MICYCSLAGSPACCRCRQNWVTPYDSLYWNEDASRKKNEDFIKQLKELVDKLSQSSSEPTSVKGR